MSMFLIGFWVICCILNDGLANFCPTGGVVYDDSICFWKINQLHAFQDMRSQCSLVSENADLAIIDTDGKLDFVKNEILSGSSGFFWIGLKDFLPGDQHDGINTNHAWIDKTPLGFHNWRSGQPNGHSIDYPDPTNVQDCVMSEVNGEWQDRKCEDSYKGICSMPYSQVLERGMFFKRKDVGKKINSKILETKATTSLGECGMICLAWNQMCDYFNFSTQDGGSCEIIIVMDSSNLETLENWSYYEVIHFI